jgi:hypothetical protein
VANQNATPVTVEELAEIRRLRTENCGRNEISHRIGRSLHTSASTARR